MALQTSALEADGKVVWSCSPVLFSLAKNHRKRIKTKSFRDFDWQRKLPARMRRAQ
jgi:hypothetical protein